MSLTSGITLKGRVLVTVRDERGRFVSRKVFKNTITNWARSGIASLIIGSPLTINSSSTTQSLPTYIAVGTGSGTPNQTDFQMYNESYQTRKSYSYRDLSFGYYAQIVVNYQTTDPNGTYTEAGLWDQDVGTTTLNANASAGANAITIPSSSSAVNAGQQIYLSNGTNAEYATVKNNYAAGSTSWQLENPLQYSYTSGQTVTLFNGNLWAHVVFTSGVTKKAGQTLTIQWQLYPQAG